MLSVLHRLSKLLIRDRAKTINPLHSFLLEFGISLPKGKAIIWRLPSVLTEHELPVRLSALLQRLQNISPIWVSRPRRWTRALPADCWRLPAWGR